MQLPGTVLLFDPVTLLPCCIMNATYLTGLRTSAGSAVATNMWALPDASILTIFGAGLQAEHHIEVPCFDDDSGPFCTAIPYPVLLAFGLAHFLGHARSATHSTNVYY